MLALALFAVLVWYTVISPSYAAVPPRAADGDTPDAEEREVERRAAGDFAKPRGAPAIKPRPDELSASDGEELDWPEIIGRD